MLRALETTEGFGVRDGQDHLLGRDHSGFIVKNVQKETILGQLGGWSR